MTLSSPLRIALFSFAMGILATLFLFHAWTIYSLRTAVNAQQTKIDEHQAALQQVVQYINTQMSKQQNSADQQIQVVK